MSFGVYIHFPYCLKRCPYCDFAVAVRRSVPHERYLQAILAELAERGQHFPGRRAVSLYFGGGTPSLWQPACIAAVREAVLNRFPPPPGVQPEVTVEADPTDLCGTLEALRQAGANRLSLGVQTFQARHLQRLGRQHSPDEARQAVRQARQAGFTNVSVDLMIGLIDQTGPELLADLEELVALAPQHVSLYQLTVETGTALSAAVRKGRARPLPDDLQAAYYDQVRERLAPLYDHYEISSFARAADLQAVHNRLYWTGGEYLGLGVSAHSFRRLPEGGERFANPRGAEPYLGLAWQAEARPLPGDDRLAHYEHLDPAALAREALWLGLRQIHGLSRAAFARAHGHDPVARHTEEIDRLCQRGLLEIDGDTLRLSRQGVLFADEVGVQLL